MDEPLLKVSERVAQSKDDWGSLSQHLLGMKDIVETHAVSTPTANKIVSQLVPIFFETKAKFPLGKITRIHKVDVWVPTGEYKDVDTVGKFQWPPFYALLEIAGRYADSAEAEDFVAQVAGYDGESSKYIVGTSYGYLMREALARSTRHKSSRKISGALEARCLKGIDPVDLLALWKVNPERAVPVIKKAFVDVKDNSIYERMASVVHQTGNPELFGAMFSRMKEFGRPVWARKEQFDAYLRVQEGDKLAEALNTMCSIGKLYSEDVLVEKIRSKNPASRIAAYKLVQCFIKAQQYRGGEPAIMALKSAADTELNPAAKKIAQEALRSWP